MTVVWAVAALVCIVLGLVVAIFDVKIVMEPLSWFVLAIAFNTLGLEIPTRKG